MLGPHPVVLMPPSATWRASATCLARAAIGHAVLPACGLPARLILLIDADPLLADFTMQFALAVPGAKRLPPLPLIGCHLPRNRRSGHTRSYG